MILASGCFDGLHAGHIAYLQKARALNTADSFVIATAPDAYIARVKGRLPRWTLNDRLTVLRALRFDNFCAYAHDEAGVASVIDRMKPAMFVKGEEWRGKLMPDVLAACERARTHIVFVPMVTVVHASEAWA